MKTSGSSSPINNIVRSAIACFLIATLFQCKGEAYLGLDRALLERKLSRGDYSFMDRVDEKTMPGPEIFSLAPGAGYYLGLAARERGRRDLGAHLLNLEVEKGAAPYRHWAARELFDLWNDSAQYEKTIRAAEDYLARFPDSAFQDRVRYSIIRARYWQKADAEVLARLQKYFPLDSRALKGKDPELSLFQAVSSCRLGRPGWEELIRDFFHSLKASSLHTRVFTYLQQEKEKLAAFPPFERELFEAKSLLADGRAREAAAKFERLLPQLKPASLSGTALAADFTTAALSGAPAARQAALLLSFAGKAAGEEKAVLFDAAGRVYAAVKDNARARNCHETALTLSADAQFKKRVLYRIFAIALDQGAEAAWAVFQAHAGRIAEPAYYDDQADEFLNRLVRERRFDRLLALAAAPPAWLLNAEKARLFYIAGRLLMTKRGRAPDPGREEAAKKYFRSVRELGARGYYSYLAAFFLKEESAAEEFFRKKPGPDAPRPREWSERGLMADGYFFFGLYQRGFALLSGAKDDIKNETLSYWAAVLTRRGCDYEAIQVLAALRERGSDTLSRAEYERYYPRAFQSVIVPAAAEFGVDEHLFFSLVRQESAFHSGIASRVGAVGLTQLMPETGAWVAEQLKSGPADLTDPAVNVRFGAYYLSFLSKRLETVPYTLAGYNAGPNVARRWKEKYGDLEPDLAVEAFDYTETRDFIKSIFSARVAYNLMYKNTGLKDTVSLFFGY